MRIGWDEYFFSICDEVAKRSACLSRQIGAVLVKDKSIICTGYNGPPRKYPHCGGNACPRTMLGFKTGEGIHLCPAAHAERNCISNAARHGICCKDSTIYLNSILPCKECMIEIVNSGIIEVVVRKWVPYDQLSIDIAEKCGIKIRTMEEYNG